MTWANTNDDDRTTEAKKIQIYYKHTTRRWQSLFSIYIRNFAEPHESIAVLITNNRPIGLKAITTVFIFIVGGLFYHQRNTCWQLLMTKEGITGRETHDIRGTNKPAVWESMGLTEAFQFTLAGVLAMQAASQQWWVGWLEHEWSMLNTGRET